MADTGSCCGGPKGKHLPGCDGSPSTSGRKNRAVAGRRTKQAEFDDAKARQKAQAKRKNIGKERDTEWMNVEIPEGYRSAKQANGKYRIVPK